MSMVYLRRTRRLTVTCAAVTALAFSGVQPASAEISNPSLVPSDSAYIISIPSAPAFWSAWESNGLYGAYNQIMAVPEMETKTASFKKELGIIESSLGFKIDGKTLSQVFGNLDIYIQGNNENDVSSAAILKITDQDKLTKLIDLAEKAAAEANASDDESSETKTGDSESTSPAKVTEYQGIQIKTVKMEDGDKHFVYARTSELLIMATSVDVVQKVVDRTKSTDPDTVATSEDFKKIDAALAAEKGEIYIYGDQDKSMAIQGGESSADLTQAIRSMVENLAPVSKYGASVKFAPKEIASYSYGLLKSGTSDSLAMKHPGDKPLNVVSYVPEGTLLAVSTSLFDAAGIYKVGLAGAESGMAKADEDKASADSSDNESIQSKIKKAEPLVGFSVEKDLIPALGNEIGFAINKVEFTGLIPQVDATIMLGVADKAKMTKVVDSLHRLGENAMAAKSSDSGTSAPAFVVDEVAGQKVNSIEIGIPGYVPGYVLTDDFLILGSTKSALKASLEANKDGKNLGTSEAFKNLGHSISVNANAIQFMDLSKVLSVASQITKSLSGSDDAGKYMEALKVLDVAGSSSRIENGAAVSHGVLKLK